MTRTDPHRPGAIIPTDYTQVLWYSLATTVEGWPQPSININCETVTLHDHSLHADGFGDFKCLGKCPQKKHSDDGLCCWVGLVQSGVKVFEHPTWGSAGPGKCSVCGAHFTYGEVWRHDPTGEHIHVGHDCADKYNMLSDRSEWERWHEQQKDMRAKAIMERVRAKERDKFLSEHPGLAEVLEVDHPILRDMKRKLHAYGSLSDKQIAFAQKLADEVNNPPAPEVLVQAPEGRLTFTGEVVSTKVVESIYGSTIKMVLKVQTPDGNWRCWVTMPSALTAHRGDKVQMTATLTRSDRDEHFAFGKRPTKAQVVA